MQEKHLFEYAVIRVVPRVEREEFINVGVILYCPGRKYLNILFDLNHKRLLAFYSEINIEEVDQRLKAFEHICAGNGDSGQIGKLPLASRFRWLTAARSTIIQTSPVHSGLCADPDETLSNLCTQLVK